MLVSFLTYYVSVTKFVVDFSAAKPQARDMKILISTTLGHNPGDEIIAQGVKRLLATAIAEDITYITYNRNPDLQTGSDRIMRSDLVGNYMGWRPLVKHVDAVVLAGSPEWSGGPLRALYEAIEAYAPDIPLYALGIGMGNENLTLSPLDIRVLDRPQTKIITRSRETVGFLANYGIKSQAMVCPALFAFDGANVRDTKSNQTLLILQRPGNRWHEVPLQILDGISADSKADILCLHVKEFEYYSGIGLSPRYAGCPESFARIVSQYSKVVSTRLHGAIGALSLGVPAVVVADGDFRIETCAKQFLRKDSYPILQIAPTVREALARGNMVGPNGISSQRAIWWDRYVEAVREAVTGSK